MGETTQEHKKWQEDERQKLELDRASNRGLFEGAFKNQSSLASIQDHQDNVLRCPMCTWELEDRVCASCGWSDLSDGGGGTVSLSEDGLSEAGSISVYSESDYPHQPFINQPHVYGNPYMQETILRRDNGSVILSPDSDEEGSVGSLDGFIINDDDDDDVAPSHPFREIDDGSEASSNLGSDMNGTLSTADSDEVQQRQNTRESEDLHIRGDPPHPSRSPDFIDIYSDGESRTGDRPGRAQRGATRNHLYGLGHSSRRRETSHNAPTYRGVNGFRSTAAPRTVDLGNTSSDDSSSHPQPPRRRARLRRMISSDDDDEPRFRMPISEIDDGSSETAVAESPEIRNRATAPRRERERSIPGAFPESFSHSEPSSQAVYLDLTSPTATETPADDTDVPSSSRNRAQGYRRTFHEPSNRSPSNLPSPRHRSYNPPSTYQASSSTLQAGNEGSPNRQPVNARRYYERFGAGESDVPPQRKRLNRQRGHRQPDELDNESVI